MSQFPLRAGGTVILLLLMAGMVAPALALPLPASVPGEVTDAFIEQTWNRTDQPVESGAVTRTWMWGEPVTEPLSEAYERASSTYVSNAGTDAVMREDERIVQYFDKARMEYDWNRPADPPWNVTTGLLVKEMMTGRLQLGDELFVQTATRGNPSTSATASSPIAGDPGSEDITPTYGDVGSPEKFADGALIDQRLVRREIPNWPGTYAWMPETNAALGEYGVTAVAVDVPTDHTVANVFWDFMNSIGMIWENGQHTTGPLFLNPFYATGYPLTEPFWGRARVQGDEKDVLMQCFERRCLTYTPDNPDGWKVEFGNVGQHYFRWRYEVVGLQLTADVTGYQGGPPHSLTMLTPDTPFDVRLQFLQNIELPPAGACYFDETMTYLSSRLSGVHVFFDEAQPEESDDGTVVLMPRRIWIGTELLNETLVREGYAVVGEEYPGGPWDGYTEYPSPLFRDRLEAAQSEAQFAGKGIWGACQQE